MTLSTSQPNEAKSVPAACPAPPSGRRFLGTGLGSGLLGGVCCIGSAVSIGAGIGGLSFFSTWMERYQTYLILASVLVMVLWLVRQVRRHDSVTGFFRGTWRQLAVMGAVYVVTLGIAMGVVALVEM